MTQADAARPERWRMLWIMVALFTFGAGSVYAIGPLGTRIMADLQIGEGKFGLLSASFFFSGFFTSTLSGLFIDRYGVRRLIILSSAVLGISLLLVRLVPMTFNAVFILLFFAGVGYSAFMPLSNAGLLTWFPPRERAFALGFKDAGAPLGRAIGAMVLPQIVLVSTWQTAYALAGAIVLLTGIVGYAVFRDSPLPEARREPPPSSPDAAAGQAAQPAAKQAVRRASRDAIIEMLKRPNMRWVYVFGTGLVMAQNSVFTFMTPFLVAHFGLPLVTAAAYFGVAQIAAMASRPLFGLISDRVFKGTRKETMVGCALLGGAALILIAFAPNQLAPFWLFVMAVVSGMLTQGWSGPYFVLVMEEAGKDLGTASGLAGTAFKLASVLGPPIFGFLVELTGTYRLALLVTGTGLAGIAWLFNRFFHEQKRLALVTAGASRPDRS